jgi:hypothetical protein
LDGLSIANGLPVPTTIVRCFDDDSAHKTVAFVGKVLNKFVKGSLLEALALKDTIKQFGNELPEEVKNCLGINE